MVYEEEAKRAKEQEEAGVAPVTDDRPVVEEGNPTAYEEPVNEVNDNNVAAGEEAAPVDGFQGRDD